ncbi:PHD-finger family protein, putative [Babesia bigemina]|uniref:PHD-finger family protein, putative n=1 Tax=Babesia bigemina TaxID=5866 RepID=A0A061DBK8_BABBI|nr:PHD-finger family protein, putative [Babesia bigemina]CDR96284.1 PHD-finger family protein, putative [Babesia bigemina]|eukprot:XP_012768470.1 PHD-finger family protein, putative [Babesia bigemina]
MDQDPVPTRETSQEEDRFWIDTDRQFFSNPNSSLLLCLRNHAWHCRYIARQSRQLLREHEEASSDHSNSQRDSKRPKLTSENAVSKIQVGGGSGATGVEARQEGSNDSGIITVTFRVKHKGGDLAVLSPGNSCSRMSPMHGVNGVDAMSYSEKRGFAVAAQHHMGSYDDDVYYNPVINAKHDNKLKLPIILPCQAPDGIRIALYCTTENSQHVDPTTSRRPGFKTNMLNDMLSPDQVPEIVYGPAPVWSRLKQPGFKDGKDICSPYPKFTAVMKEIHGPVADPVWECPNDMKRRNAAGVGDMLRALGLTDVSPPCTIDYSPKLFSFVEAKSSPLCRRCLGMPKVVCSLCSNMEIANNIPGVCFSNPTIVDHKYELVYNGLDIYHMRTLMGTEKFKPPIASEAPIARPLKRSHDDDVTAVLKEYVETLEEIDATFSTLIERVQAEKKPNFDYWSQVESQMIKSYIDQYNNKMMDNRYNYNTQRQSYDVLRIRLTCTKSSNLPAHWTDHALCSVCGSDEDWDDDPILFCDCCYIPMHYCCLGYKPGTMSETMKQNIRRHKLLHTKEDDEPIVDEDEWLCPCCLFLMDQLAFLSESTAMKAIRVAAGPRNKQTLEFFRDNPPDDNALPLEAVPLPYVVGFEYDNPMERIDLCTVYRRNPAVAFASAIPTGNEGPAGGRAALGDGADAAPKAHPRTTSSHMEYLVPPRITFKWLLECGNIPTTVVLNIPDEEIACPFEKDLRGYEMDLLGRTINQFWSFKRMIKTNLDIASDIFDEILVRYMNEGNLDGMLKLLRHVPKEEANTHNLIHQDRALQQQKSITHKRGRKPVDVKVERTPQVMAAINAEVVRGPEQEIVRDDIYTFNCKNPLKKLVICTRISRNFFVNLRIPVCIFCGFDAYYPGGGPMKRTSNPGTWAHIRCAIAVDCTITPKYIDYETFVPKVKALKCLVCHNLSTAIVQCSHGNCCKAVHVSCAAASSYCLFSWDQNGKPDILCPQHASGLAPTVLLRKLQTKVQYKNFKKMSTYETNLDGINPKDDVYLSHLLEPNYRSIASVIEQIFNLNPRTGFPIPLYGDEVVFKQPIIDKDCGEKSMTERSGENKGRVSKRTEVRLPLRDKSGKFKVADKSREIQKVEPISDKDFGAESQQIKTTDLAVTTATVSSNNVESDISTSNVQEPADVPMEPLDPTEEPEVSGNYEKIEVDQPEEIELSVEQADATDDVAPADSVTESKPMVEIQSTDQVEKATSEEVSDPNFCRVTKLAKEHCFWCSMGNEDSDEHTHYKPFYDDRCPTSEQIGNLLFPDLDAAKQKGAAMVEDSAVEGSAHLENIPPIVWSEICASTRIVDEKMLSYISDDFIGGQRLISEVVSKSCRASLLGLTRLLNILYFKSKKGSEMCAVFDSLLRHMKTMQSVDEARRNCEIGTNSATEAYPPLPSFTPDYSGGHRVNHPPVDHRKECRVRVKAVLRTLNQTVFMRLEPELLPVSILRVVVSKSNPENGSDVEVSRHYVVCSGCLEFKVIEQEVSEENSVMRKRVNYAHHYKTCRMCNARACSDCLSHMKAARMRTKVSLAPVPLNVAPAPTDAYMSAATLLSQPMYPGVNLRMPRNPPPMPDDERIPSVRDAMISLPLMARGPMIDGLGPHPVRGIGVSAPMSVDARMPAMMAPNMARGPMNAPSPIRHMISRPQIASSAALRGASMVEMAGLPPTKPTMMPICTPMAKSMPSPGVCGPLYSGTGGKTVPGMMDRTPGMMCGGPFGKVGPMIKSPPVKNGPYATTVSGPSFCRDVPPPNGPFVGNGDLNNCPPVSPPSLIEPPDENSEATFLCSRCEDMEGDINVPLLCCAFCSRFDGLLVPVNREHLSFYLNWTSEYCGYAYVHLVCLDWLSYSKVVSPSLRKFPKTLLESPCHYCGVACGATLTCTNNYCNVRFHASCGAWLGCKADMGKKPEGLTTASRRVYCLRHTFLNISRMSQVERKFMIAPPHLYELLISTKHHLSRFYGGVYMSRYCVPNKIRNEAPSRPPLSRIPASTTSTAKRAKPLSKASAFPMNNVNATMNMLNGINYMNLGLVVSKSNFGQPVSEYSMLPDNIARDRLIQALNWTAYNAMNLVGGRRDKKEIRAIIHLIKAGQLKPIHGSKRGRKPKSLDGSNFDNRQKMPMEDILTYCHSGQLDSGEFFCPVCFSIYFERSPGMPGDDLHWIGCDGCERWFHFVCAGVWAEGQVDPNSPSWFCLACTRQRAYKAPK